MLGCLFFESRPPKCVPLNRSQILLHLRIFVLLRFMYTHAPRARIKTFHLA